MKNSTSGKPTSGRPCGNVASLHLHPPAPGTPLTPVDAVETVAKEGIRGEPRYFGRKSSRTGEPNRRQVTLMEREQIAQHAIALGLEGIAPGVVRANIETKGVALGELLGRRVRVGEAILHFYEPRTPCAQMDAIRPGLRALMEGGRQGMLAEGVKSGSIRVGDAITVVDSE